MTVLEKFISLPVIQLADGQDHSVCIIPPKCCAAEIYLLSLPLRSPLQIHCGEFTFSTKREK